MDMNRPTDLITTREAIKLLHISPSTMSRLIKDGVLNHFVDLLDKRVKLVSRAEVEALKAQSRKAA
jgi:predicted DNA-binding transcriptional regulator AlpA